MTENGSAQVDVAVRVDYSSPEAYIRSVEETYEATPITIADALNEVEWQVVDKETLVGVPFVITEWTAYEGTKGPFVAVKVLTNNGRLLFNDGSTGIYKQLGRIEEKFRVPTFKEPFVPVHNGSVLVCKKGLRKSEYVVDGIEATTYYLT